MGEIINREDYIEKLNVIFSDNENARYGKIRKASTYER